MLITKVQMTRATLSKAWTRLIGRTPSAYATVAEMKRKRVAILISGRGSNMAALIQASKDPAYPAQVVLVISNRPNATGIERARAAGVPTAVIDHTWFKDRESFEQQLQSLLEAHNIEIVCLAGFMRLLTPSFVDRWKGKLLNVHPALLPAFKGLHTHERALQAGVALHGATVHFVVPEMDSGPILARVPIRVRPNDTPDSLAARVLRIEHRIYTAALKSVAEGRVSIVDGHCQVDGEPINDRVLFVINNRRRADFRESSAQTLLDDTWRKSIAA